MFEKCPRSVSMSALVQIYGRSVKVRTQVLACFPFSHGRQGAGGDMPPDTTIKRPLTVLAEGDTMPPGTFVFIFMLFIYLKEGKKTR